ncbi:MAG: rhamnulokinase [Bacteroidales bacterium]|nr:rhamnulokinase [Bacteroidales bacterium]
MKSMSFLAFDLGATSGRSLLATLANGRLTMKELTRFPNKITELQGKYYWDIYSLYNSLKEGLQACSKEGIAIDAIGIDTWGVDFVYLGEDGTILSSPRAYRDPYTEGIPEILFQTVSKREVYEHTGIQIMNFNSLFQLYAAKRENYSPCIHAKEILFMPDALSYLLTGKKVCEYTMASTSQMLNPRTRDFDRELLEKVGISPDLFPPIIMPGTKIGYLTKALANEYELQDVPVIAVAGHDTGSAVAAVPAENERFAYLSSGTWSLMGIEVKDPIINDASYEYNFTNEGGIEGTTRFLKNITGMWLLEQCRKEWDKQEKNYSYPHIVKMAQEAPAFQHFVDPDDASFVNPASMIEAIKSYCLSTGQSAPETDQAIIRCIFESLALKYRYVFSNLQKLAPFKIEKLHVIGGGAKNALLNQFTANSLNLPVIAGPSEATAIGNIMVQAKAMGAVDSLQEMRNIIYNSIDIEKFAPTDQEKWEKAYNQFKNLIN